MKDLNDLRKSGLYFQLFSETAKGIKTGDIEPERMIFCFDNLKSQKEYYTAERIRDVLNECKIPESKFQVNTFGEMRESSSGSSVFPVVNKDGVFRFTFEKDFEQDRYSNIKNSFDSQALTKLHNTLNVVKRLIGNLFKEECVILNWGYALKLESMLHSDISQIQGESYQLALAAAFISHVFVKPIPKEFAFSGQVGVSGDVLTVNDINEKLNLMNEELHFIKYFVIPKGNDTGRESHGNDGIETRYISNIDELCIAIWGKPLKEIFQESKLNFRNLGIARIYREPLTSEVDKLVFSLDDKSIRYNEFPVDFPLPKDHHKKGYLLDGIVANYIVGYNMATNCNKIPTIFAIKDGNGNSARVFFSYDDKQLFKAGDIIDINTMKRVEPVL
ncbi:MAG: hypothetical protein SCALA702_28240 [Melioribacteraceae bacterium]|nr:MAG: hypothetical protein SCALA702_28240 [Melioribacteraceae bacterium]